MTNVINGNISEAFIPTNHSVSVISAQVEFQKKNVHRQPITRAVLYICLF